MEGVLEVIDKVCQDKNLLNIVDKVLVGKRLSFEDGLGILKSEDLNTIGLIANYVKRKREGDRVYFVVNRHINPTNICAISCKFCAFGKAKGSAGTYEMSFDEIVASLNEELREVHVVGGLHPDWPFEHYLDIVRVIKEALPNTHVKAYTAVEIDWFSEISGLSVEEVLIRMKEAGVDALPGGGAEIFAEEVRKKICAPKTSSQRWLDIHRTAHSLGIPSNATILYGHLERYEDVVDHLERLRNLQDETQGFLAFIPVLFQPENTRLKNVKPFPGSYDLKVHALARLYLDNFPHIKAYWITLGEKVAQVALHFGADDADGTIIREKIIHDAGAPSEVGHTREFFVSMIKSAGYTPVERDALYNVVRVYS
ncbi:Aminodeoxyfutalosine synthase [bacterium HR37]|jgi:aminodeoxyfutalosine synthase|nr:Aminodeoxyfutalosine synthase [bacterium HR37]